MLGLTKNELKNIPTWVVQTTIVFLDKSSNLIHRLRGYKSPKQIEVYLKLFTDENFKQIQTQEDFQKFYDSFEYEFGSK